MWKLKKILKTILIFCLVMVLICFLYSVQKALNSNIESTEILDETLKYLLYTIGYGDAVEGNGIEQNIFALLGIISIALMTTYLTLNLFWRVDDVKISNKIAIFKKRENFSGEILFANEGNDICDLKVDFISYDSKGNVIINEDEEYTYPLLVKKSMWRFEIPLGDIFWFKSLKSMMENNIEIYIYLTFSFVDIKTGQSSIKVLKYSKDDIIGINNLEDFAISNRKSKPNQNILDEFKQTLLSNIEKYDISALTQVENGGSINLQYDIDKGYNLATINFPNTSTNDEFVMALFQNNEDKIHFERFFTENAVFRTILSGNDGVKYVTLEIKKANGATILSKKMQIKDEPIIYEYKLADMLPANNKDEVENYLKGIKEICFTIFKEDMCSNNATIKIYKAEVDAGQY